MNRNILFSVTGIYSRNTPHCVRRAALAVKRRYPVATTPFYQSVKWFEVPESDYSRVVAELTDVCAATSSIRVQLANPFNRP